MCALALALLGTSAGMAPAEPIAVTQIAEGVYLHVGKQLDAGPDNRGDIANIGFIVGEKCVAIVDTGGSLPVGRELREALRKLTPLPVCYVVNTHVHPDHIFGNAAFADDRPVFVGHARLAAAMAARGGTYLNALRRDYGALAEGTEVIPPTRSVADRLELDLGGRVLEMRAWPTAHTDNDLTVFDRKTGTLWLSDLLFVERIPVVDGSLRGWLALHEQLRNLPARQVVPGHGPVQASAGKALEEQARYLRVLRDETRAAIKAGHSLARTVAEVGLGESERWLLHESFHRRNVTAAYAELEWED